MSLPVTTNIGHSGCSTGPTPSWGSESQRLPVPGPASPRPLIPSASAIGRREHHPPLATSTGPGSSQFPALDSLGFRHWPPRTPPPSRSAGCSAHGSQQAFPRRHSCYQEEPALFFLEQAVLRPQQSLHEEDSVLFFSGEVSSKHVGYHNRHSSQQEKANLFFSSNRSIDDAAVTISPERGYFFPLTTGALTATTLPLHQQKPVPSLFLTTITTDTSTTRETSLFSSSSTNKHVDNDHP